MRKGGMHWLWCLKCKMQVVASVLLWSKWCTDACFLLCFHLFVIFSSLVCCVAGDRLASVLQVLWRKTSSVPARAVTWVDKRQAALISLWSPFLYKSVMAADRKESWMPLYRAVHQQSNVSATEEHNDSNTMSGWHYKCRGMFTQSTG